MVTQVQETAANTTEDQRGSLITKPRYINKCYIISFCFNVALGFVQFGKQKIPLTFLFLGLALGSFNTVASVFAIKYEWTISEKSKHFSQFLTLSCYRQMGHNYYHDYVPWGYGQLFDWRVIRQVWEEENDAGGKCDSLDWGESADG